MALGGQYLGIYLAGRGYMGSRFGGDGDPHIHAPQYGCAMHSEANCEENFPGGGA